jgi:2-polyprenyl-6-methoxyphenol hydroxylase-like FAD-dependent oxidoreductase
VGAGIGGLAAALALRNAGWNVWIFERTREPRELGFGLLLAPNAIAALRALAMFDRTRPFLRNAAIRATPGWVMSVATSGGST